MAAFATSARVRRAAHVARRALNDYNQPLPKLRTSSVQRRAPAIYVCTPDYDVPSGGIRVAYRHVDLLNDAGIPAVVLHRRPNFRCTWFENRTRVLDSRHAVIGPDDLVVVGELGASLLASLPPGFRFVVLNQNPHLTWRRVSEHDVQRYARSPDLAAIVTVSDHSAAMLRHAAPGARVIRVHNSIDPRLFFAGGQARERTIAYMPRRGSDEAAQVLGIMRGRGALRGWDVTALDGLTERAVADRLRSATIFLSFAYHEGFGLPAAEAMACGAYVVGFDGFSGREFFRSEFSSPVAAADVVGFARTLESVLERAGSEPGWCEARGAAAAKFIATEYSPQRERREVVGAYGSLLTQR